MDVPAGVTQEEGNTGFSIHLLRLNIYIPGIYNIRSILCFVCFLPIHSGLQWTYQPGSHRKKVTQDF